MSTGNVVGFGPFTDTPAKVAQPDPRISTALNLLSIVEQISVLRQSLAHNEWSSIDLTKVENFSAIVSSGNEINHEHDVQQQISALRNRINNWKLNLPWYPNAQFPEPSDNVEDVLTKYIEDLGLKYV